MRSSTFSALFVLLTLASVAGCWRTASEPPGGGEPPVWVENDIEHAGMTISLGYRGDPPQAGNSIEPVAMITRDGVPVANAMVFNSLVAGSDTPEGGEDTPTVYELSSDRTLGHYAQGKLLVPAGAKECTVRFRIVFADAKDDWTHDMQVAVR